MVGGPFGGGGGCSEESPLEAEARAAVIDAPDDVMAWKMYVHALLEVGKRASAARAFRRLGTLAPNAFERAHYMEASDGANRLLFEQGSRERVSERERDGRERDGRERDGRERVSASGSSCKHSASQRPSERHSAGASEGRERPSAESSESRESRARSSPMLRRSSTLPPSMLTPTASKARQMVAEAQKRGGQKRGGSSNGMCGSQGGSDAHTQGRVHHVQVQDIVPDLRDDSAEDESSQLELSV